MTTTRPYQGRYSEEEVLVLVEEYEELRELKSRAYIHIRLMDLEQALHKLPPKEYQAVLLCGLIGLSTRWAGEALGSPKSTIYDRYWRGMKWLHQILNGQTRTV